MFLHKRIVLLLLCVGMFAGNTNYTVEGNHDNYNAILLPDIISIAKYYIIYGNLVRRVDDKDLIKTLLLNSQRTVSSERRKNYYTERKQAFGKQCSLLRNFFRILAFTSNETN